MRDLDARVVAASKGIRVLSGLSWPAHVIDQFLERYRRGEAALPEHVAEPLDYREERDALAALKGEIDSNDPMGRYLDETAGSYAIAARMLEVPGTPEFHELSLILYGKPTDTLPGSTTTHLAAADHLLEATDALAHAGLAIEPELVLSAEMAKVRFEERLDAFFGKGVVDVEIDDDLASKAAAGSKRVRIRGRTGFAETDIEQLLEHEAFVHTATALNGRAQPLLSSLSLGAPRTTLTQEGLATVAELVTRTIDVGRLRRIALRIRAIHLATEGADFVEVFRFFLTTGQSDEESVRSTMRVFRGGDLRGKYVFTKDVVYLQGLLAVHTFLRKAIAQKRGALIARLFAGRMQLGDVLLLEDAFEAGHVAPPKYLPPWAKNLPALAAYLAFSAVAYRIDLDGVDIERILRPQDL